ncbi:MAG: type I-B CRISPR-associated protein Cas7/Csh2 [bacterium]
MSTITNNSDFLFLYDATQSNPNGDPDQENKPRMDYDTKTNLVTDVRVKRFIRDYLKMKGNPIFVDMEGDSKVSVDSKLIITLDKLLSQEDQKNDIFKDKPKLKERFEKIIENKKKDEGIADALKNKEILKDKENQKLNYHILKEIVKKKYPDLRMFGSAFAVQGFSKSYTGAIQLNWGYSLNKVELMDSDSLVTIMNDGSSTFGKDYRVHYSLLAFNGTVNKFAAQTTGLSDNDMELFREGIWNSITALPTRSKLNQYPKLYLEIIYNDEYHNGYFGDLRNYVEAQPKEGIQDKQVRGINDLNLDFSKLEKLINDNKGEGKPINDIIVYQSDDLELNL